MIDCHSEVRPISDRKPIKTQRLREYFHRAVEHATLAPSSHNSQPWLFEVSDDSIDVIADRSRGLPVVDPHDRELVISCGAALDHLQIALMIDRIRTQPHLLPYGASSDRIAHLTVESTTYHPTEDDEQFFQAIPKRHTNREAFQQTRVPTDVRSLMTADMRREGVWSHFTDVKEEKEQIVDLVCEGDRIQAADKRFRRELAQWVHSNRSHTRDGMPGYAHGIGDLASNFGSFVVRTFDWGDGQAAKDRQLAEGSPLLLVIGTKSDSPEDWIRCGQALSRMLLRATSAGLSASYLNQPIEVESLRPRLSELLGYDGYPQLLLRLGYGNPVRPTPRRPARDVIVDVV